MPSAPPPLPQRAAQLAPEPPLSLKTLLLTVLLPFSLAHFFSYIFRNINAVVYPDLARELDLRADSLGFLTATYMLAFACAQLPIGVALDRFGPRKVQVPLLMIAAIGAVWFSFAHNLHELVMARAMIGLGVAGSLMSAIKASSIWFSPQRLSLCTAVLLAVGGLGGMTATLPVQSALQWMEWRTVFQILAVGTVVVVGLIFFLVPAQKNLKPSPISNIIKGVGQLYKSWSFWRLALYSLMSHGAFMALQGLWLGPWLKDVAHLPRNEVSNVLLICAVGMVLGSLAFGWLGDLALRHRIQPVAVCGLGMIAFLIFQIFLIFPYAPLTHNTWILGLGLSFFGICVTMNYAILAQSVDTQLTGRVSTCYNLLIFLTGFAYQWGMGLIIGQWDMAEDGSYPLTAYQSAIGIGVLIQLPGLILWLTFKPWKKIPEIPGACQSSS